MGKIYHVDLTPEEREKLEEIVKRRKSSCEASKRSQILLAADRNGDKKWTDAQIAAEYKVSIRTIERLREKFIQHNLEVALKGLPRPNLDKIKFDAHVEAQLLSLRCSNPTEGRSSWTLNLLKDKLIQLNIVESISRESVSQLLKKRNKAVAR